ncbi:MAG: DNA polymerase III, subunit gamma and tau [Betaproteobacteria bacterium RIFCSPLOWO2_12_FULL_64_23]|nr:MAG: DNA polymerase III, subunit gamma and tau [Betaproteobacteria bacterium RIFCSPLOWO2_12_FULL_64_23]
MSYQVLARKWRPRNFASLVGQEHVVRALTHALEQQRLHHAYLFTGTRGVGKTTIARILAKALNCETGISSTPCGVCSACTEIDSGRFVDLIEIDAATNTGIDDMRELQDNALYAPTRGRFKVFVIDEVHMLSKQAFNSMLKTFEEPPEHIKFILATTDPQKIPVTVLSRCLQFNLKQMAREAIYDHLGYILQQEGSSAEPLALRLIARAAQGSMRDALSLLDQAIAYAGGKVSEDAVRAMLGTIDQDYLFKLLDGLAQQDIKAMLDVAGEMESRSLSFDSALQDLATLLHQIALAQSAPEALGQDRPERERILALAQQFDAEELQLHYQIALHGRRDLALAPDEYAGFSMSLMRMLAFRPAEASGAAAPAPAMPGAPIARDAATAVPAPAPPGARSGAAAAAASGAAFDGDWPMLANRLKVSGVARQLAQQSELRGFDGERMELGLAFSAKHLADRTYQDKLRAALQEHFGKPVALKIVIGEISGNTAAVQAQGERQARQGKALEAIQGDAFVRDLMDIFDATIVGDSVKPT